MLPCLPCFLAFPGADGPLHDSQLVFVRAGLDCQLLVLNIRDFPTIPPIVTISSPVLRLFRISVISFYAFSGRYIRK